MTGEEVPKKKLPKVKISITLSPGIWKKVKEIENISGVTPSAMINYVLKNTGEGSLDWLKEYYEGKKEEGDVEE